MHAHTHIHTLHTHTHRQRGGEGRQDHAVKLRLSSTHSVVHAGLTLPVLLPLVPGFQALFVVAWTKMVPIGHCVWMINHQGVELFEKIRRSRRCGLDRESMPIGCVLTFQNPMPEPISLSAYGWGYSSQILLQCLSVCQQAPNLDDDGLSLWNCKKAPN